MKVVLDDNVFSVIGSDYRLEHLLIYLIRNADKEGRFITTYKILEEETGLAKSTINRSLKTLSEGNILALKKVSSKEVGEVLMERNVERNVTIITICNIRRLRGLSNVNGTGVGTELGENNDKLSFEKLWDLYKKKEGPKDRLRKKWNTFDEETKEKVFEFVPKYVALTEYKYRKMLSTFLNQRTWENETISVGYDSINVNNFNASLLVDGENSLFYQFVDHFNKYVAGTKIPPVDMRTGLTEERRVKFNIAYCLKYHQIKLVMEKVLASPSLNGEKGFVASYDFIFDQRNFQKIYEGVYDR